MATATAQQLKFLEDNLDAALKHLQWSHTWQHSYPPVKFIKAPWRPVEPDLRTKAERASEIVLYVHVPFCTQKCDFCHFYRPGDLGSFGSREYADCLKAELDYLHRLNPDRTVLSLYVGGGTPTMLEPRDLGGFLEHARSRFRFAPDADVAVESEPMYLSQAMVDAFAKAGVTESVIGVQSFDETVAHSINRRRQTNAQVHEGVGRLRAAGIRVGLDLIFGLRAGESGEEFVKANVPHLRELKPDVLAIHPLENFRKHPDHLKAFPLDDLDALTRRVDQELGLSAKRPVPCQYTYYNWGLCKNVMSVGLGGRGYLWQDGALIRRDPVQNRDNDFMSYRSQALEGRVEHVWFKQNPPDALRYYVIWNLFRSCGVLDSVIDERFSSVREDFDALMAGVADAVTHEDGVWRLKPDFSRTLPLKTGTDLANYFLFAFCRLYTDEVREAVVAHLRAALKK